MECEQHKAGGIELVAHWIAVLLDERRFAGAVGFVGLGNLIMAAAGPGDPLANRAAGLLAFQQIACHRKQPLAVLRRVLHAHHPRQAQENARPLDVVAPAPAGGIHLHGHRQRVGGLLKKRRIPRPAIGPEITGPQAAFKMRGVVDRVRIMEMLPAVGFQGADINAVSAKALLSGGAEIGQQRPRYAFVPAFGLQHVPRQHGAQDTTAGVVAVIGAQPRGRDVSPGDMTIRPVLRIRPRPLAHAGGEINIIQQVRSDHATRLSAIQRQHHGGLDVAILAQRQALQLRAVGKYPRGITFQDAQRAIALGSPRRRQGRGFAIGG